MFVPQPEPEYLHMWEELQAKMSYSSPGGNRDTSLNRLIFLLKFRYRPLRILSKGHQNPIDYDVIFGKNTQTNDEYQA